MINQYKELQETKQVQNYGLAEWLKDIQEAIREGYEFDFDSNEGYPQAIGHVFTCIMKLRRMDWLGQVGKNADAVFPDLDFPPIEEPRVYPGGSKDGSPTIPAPVIGDLLPDKQAEPSAVFPSTSAEDLFVPLFQDEEPVVTPEVEQPAKRGPKPKNK